MDRGTMSDQDLAGGSTEGLSEGSMEGHVEGLREYISRTEHELIDIEIAIDEMVKRHRTLSEDLNKTQRELLEWVKKEMRRRKRNRRRAKDWYL